MNEDKIIKLINAMNSMLDDDVASTSISPTHLTRGLNSPSESVVFTKDDSNSLYESLNTLKDSEKYMLHAVLHKFYAAGIKQYNGSVDIVKMHNKLKTLIDHRDFDRLDRTNDKNA